MKDNVDIGLLNTSTLVIEGTKTTLQLVGSTRVALNNALPNMRGGGEIHDSLTTGNFGFISQGIYDKDGILQKTELLARLQGVNGTIFPDVFIPIIEKIIGYKNVFDYMVLEKAFEAIARTKSIIPCAININPSTFANGEYFLMYVDRLQKLYDVNSTQVILEILETEPIDDYTSFNQILAKFRQRGYKIAVDDFHPVGNHNLFCIDNLHEIDTVKFDGVYMCELYTHRGEESVTQELHGTLRRILDKHPHIDIVIEKIEDSEMFEFFRGIFRDLKIESVSYQGYYFDQGSPF